MSFKFRILILFKMSRLRSPPPSETDGDGVPRQPIGVSAQNAPVYAPYRHTERQLASDLSRMISDGENVGAHIPAPDGVEFRGASKSQLRLTISGNYARRRRRVFGYVGDIQLETEARGTTAPAHLQIDAIISWRYGGRSREDAESFIFAILNAFASKALHPNPAVCAIVGGAIVGFADPSSGDSESARLTGRGETDVLTWHGASIGAWLDTAVFLLLAYFFYF